MSPAFWIVATALLAAVILRVRLGGSAGVVAATIAFTAGGLPHGAYDIALLRRAVSLDRSWLVLATGGYGAVAAAMAGLWIAAPIVALVLFLAVAAVHFGEDWQMLEEPLIRVAAGTAVIAAPAIAHPAAVTAVFVAMSDERAALIAQLAAAAAPVALMVTAVGIAIVWRDGAREWAAAMTACLILLLVLPPVAGFVLFFVFVHSPRHLAEARAALTGMTRRRWLATGGMVSAAAVLGWWGVEALAAGPIGATPTARAFQLLAAVALPHLLLSRWLEARLRLDRSPHASQETICI